MNSAAGIRMLTSPAVTREHEPRMWSVHGIPPRQTALRRHRASPLAWRLAAERGIPLDDMQGSGAGGRIVRLDIESAIRSLRLGGLASAVSSMPTINAQTPLRFGADIAIDDAMDLGRSISAYVTPPISLEALLIKPAVAAFAGMRRLEGGMPLTLRVDDEVLIHDIARMGIGAISDALAAEPAGDRWLIITGMRPCLMLRYLGDCAAGEASPVALIANAIQLVIGSSRERVVAVSGIAEIVSSVRCALLADSDALGPHEAPGLPPALWRADRTTSRNRGPNQ